MPSLVDHIDRFAYTIQSIQSTSKQVAPNPRGPFVRAALETPLWNLARDIDESELGLFTLVSNSTTHAAAAPNEDGDANVAQKTELTRVEFLGATPLRKQAGARKVDEKEPEVYAEAALKYLDKFQSIRPIPSARADVVELLDHLASLREEIDALSEAAEQDAQTGPVAASNVKDEERRIQELTARLKQLKTRKDILLKRRRPLGNTLGSPKLYTEDDSEDAFWTEPKAARSKSKARQSLVISSADDSLLLDSPMDMNIADVSMDSLADMPPTPLPSRLKNKAPDNRTFASKEVIKTPPEPMIQNPKEASPPFAGEEAAEDESSEDDLDEVDEGEGEKTVVLPKPPAVQLPEPARTPSPPAKLPSSVRPSAPATPPATQEKSRPVTPGTKTRISAETEKIVAKIWSTVGDVISPGHPFNVAAAATTNKPPRAKETIALLQNLSSQSPSPSSPSTHSISSLGDNTPSSGQSTAPQILTALLLLTLLSNPPAYALPLAKAKEVLSAKGIGASMPTGAFAVLTMGSQALETKALYGCIAKRLLKIDRGGKEQILKFDVV